MHFAASGVEVSPFIPFIVAFLVSALTSPAGVSGAFLLLPFQMSVLGFTSPAVSPTNLIYNIVAIPGGLYRYLKEGRMAWPLTWVVVLGSLPGTLAGSIVRIIYLPDPRTFKLFVGIVLLYLGGRLLYETLRFSLNKRTRNRNSARPVRQGSGLGEKSEDTFAGAKVKTTILSLRKVEYEFWGEKFAFNTLTVFLLALVVGVIGGIYGIGGGALIAPFLVTILGLPVYTVAGAALAGTFITSIAGILYFHILATTSLGSNTPVAPDWPLGLLFGLGGFAGTYLGARLQKFLPERWIQGVLGVLATFLALTYVAQFFTS